MCKLLLIVRVKKINYKYDEQIKSVRLLYYIYLQLLYSYSLCCMVSM
jgi:hypothetical protein